LLYPVEEALQLLGLGRSKFYEEVAAGRIRVVKVGRTTRVAAPDLDGYVALLRSEARETVLAQNLHPRGASSPERRA
jgi:excisionase family DNA binding protein